MRDKAKQEYIVGFVTAEVAREWLIGAVKKNLENVFGFEPKAFSLWGQAGIPGRPGFPDLFEIAERAADDLIALNPEILKAAAGRQHEADLDRASWGD